MATEKIRHIKTAFKLLIIFSILTGFVYPALVTVLAQVFFTHEANGSLIEAKGKIIGSRLIGQAFSSNAYFWGRPSATAPFPYNAASSSGSNLGPSNPDFLAKVKTRVENIHKTHPENKGLVPVDLVTASASGLDPEISPKAAFYQVSRVAKARGLPEAKIQALIYASIENRTFGLLGEPRVKVLSLNLALDKLSAAH